MFVGTRGDHARPSLHFMDRSSWANEEIVISLIFYFWIDLCRHTRRLCLPLFYVWFDLRSMALSPYRSLLAQMNGVYALLQCLGWDDQSWYFLVPVSYRCTVRARSRSWWSLCLNYTRNRSPVVFLLNFGLVSLPFLVNNGSDKPSKFWCSLYVVGINWGEVEVCLSINYVGRNCC